MKSVKRLNGQYYLFYPGSKSWRRINDQGKGIPAGQLFAPTIRIPNEIYYDHAERINEDDKFRETNELCF